MQQKHNKQRKEKPTPLQTKSRPWLKPALLIKDKPQTKLSERLKAAIKGRKKRLSHIPVL